MNLLTGIYAGLDLEEAADSHVENETAASTHRRDGVADLLHVGQCSFVRRRGSELADFAEASLPTQVEVEREVLAEPPLKPRRLGLRQTSAIRRSARRAYSREYVRPPAPTRYGDTIQRIAEVDAHSQRHRHIVALVLEVV